MKKILIIMTVAILSGCIGGYLGLLYGAYQFEELNTLVEFQLNEKYLECVEDDANNCTNWYFDSKLDISYQKIGLLLDQEWLLSNPDQLQKYRSWIMENREKLNKYRQQDGAKDTPPLQ